MKKIRLFKKYGNGIVFNNQCYFADGSKSTEIPEGAIELKENEIRNLKRILDTIPQVIGGFGEGGG